MAPWKELPYNIEPVTPEEDRMIKKCLLGYTKPFVRCGEAGYIMPDAFKKYAEEIYNLEVRADDIWVITFPRSGTTWTQEMVWLLQNDLDFKTAKAKPLYERFPMLDLNIAGVGAPAEGVQLLKIVNTDYKYLDTLGDSLTIKHSRLTPTIPEIAHDLIKVNFMNLGNFQGMSQAVKVSSVKSIAEAPSPRFIKTHLPLSFLPPNLLQVAKVVYVARDPRDVAVSYFYLHKMVAKSLLRCNMQLFWETFRRDLLPWSPVVKHSDEAWRLRHNPNLNFIFYEDLIQDLPKQIRNMCSFLNREYSKQKLEELAKYLSFDSLRKNKHVNNTPGKEDNVQFIRKGEAGGWKSHFDEKMELQAEEYLVSRLEGVSWSYPSFPMTENTRL